MANTPLLNATVKITVKDLVNSSSAVLKTYSSVTGLYFDYSKGMVNVVDTTGSFYFPLNTLTTLTYTITAGVNGQHAVVAS